MQISLHKITSKIVNLARSGSITCARKVFDEMSDRDAVAWNAMLSSYSQLGLHREALSLFRQMRIANVKPDGFSFTATLNACAGLGEPQIGTKIHALVILSGYNLSLPVNNSLIDLYGKCLLPHSANNVFEETCLANQVTWCSLLFAHVNAREFNTARGVFNLMPKKVQIAWNIMIAGYARDGEIAICIDMFREMRETFCDPDQWTFSSLMNACAEALEYSYGTAFHALIIKMGWSSAVEAKNSILSFYVKQGYQDDAMKEFDTSGMLTQVSWNAILDGYVKRGNICEASNLFHLLPEKNVISWTSMIAGLARNGEGEQALGMFVEMIRNDISPDDVTFGAALHACSTLAVLGHGKMVHGCIIRYGFQGYLYVNNGLVNMYAKSGDVKESRLAFDNNIDKDSVSWNTMLFALGMHGLANEALQLYEDMVASEVKPDKVTFIGLLMTCSHSGLIKEGRLLFKEMKSVFGLCYEPEHVVCMVDMLGRSGYVAEAEELASELFDKSGGSREALLGACSAHGNVESGTYIGEDLKISDPHNDMCYVLLSNLYCSSGQWREAEVIRKEMVDKGVKKIPGCSWIEVRNGVKIFVSGNHLYSEPNTDMKQLCKILNSLQLEMKNQCFF